MTKAKVLLMALAFAGGCNSADNLKRAEQQQADNHKEALQRRAELNQEQQAEQRELEREIAENERDLRGTGGIAEDRVDEREEARTERRKLDRKQAKELNALQGEREEQRAEDAVNVQEARSKVEKKRAEIVKDTREELNGLDRRTQKLTDQLNAREGTMEERNAVASVLATVPAQRKAIEADLEALESVRAENLNRAHSELNKRLTALDNTLHKAESRL